MRTWFPLLGFWLIGLSWLAGQDAPRWLEDSPPGGEVFALAVDSGNPDRIYAAADTLYVTRNRGVSWQDLAPPVQLLEGFDDIIAGPNPEGVFYAVNGSQLLRGDNGGTDLRVVDSPRDFGFADLLAVDPRTANRLYVFDGFTSLLLRSEDGGRSWQDINPRADFRARDLALNPARPDVLLTVGNGELWKSNNRGVSWSLELRVSRQDMELLSAVAFLSQREALAAGLGVWISGDGGLSWFAAPNPPEDEIVGLRAASSTPPRILAFTEPGGVLRSTSGGSLWQPVTRGLEGRQVTDVQIDPRDALRSYAATRLGGVHITRNGGESWQVTSDGMGAVSNQVLELESGALLAATDGGIFLRSPGDPRWTRRGGIEGAARATALARTSVGLYAATEAALLFSRNQGRSWQPLEHPDLTAGCRDIAARDGRPESDGMGAETSVIFCLNRLPSLGLSRIEHDGESVSVRQARSGGDTITEIVIDPLQPRRIYASTAHFSILAGLIGGILISEDDGETWRFLDPARRGLSGVAASPARPGRVVTFVGSHLWISDDGGENFISTGLPDPADPVQALLLDSKDGDTIFAATRSDLLVTRNSGQSFARLSGSLPPGLFQGLSLSATDPATLLAATRSGVFKLALEQEVHRIPLAFGGTALGQATTAQLLLYNSSSEDALDTEVALVGQGGRQVHERISIPARGLRQLPASDSVSGWVEARPVGAGASPIAGNADESLGLLNFLAAGAPVAAAGPEPLRQSFVLPVLDGKIEGASTLLALANPGEEPRAVRLSLRNPDSGRLAQADLHVPARGQRVLSLADIDWRFAPGLETDLERFVGYVEGQSAPAPLLATGLLQVGSDLATLGTASPETRTAFQEEAAAGPHSLLFPQFGHGEESGARLTARLAVFNPAPVPVAAQAEFLSSDGTPLPTALNGDSPSGRVSFTVGAHSLVLLETPPIGPDRLDLGWLRLRTPRPLDGWLILAGNLGTAVLRGTPAPGPRPGLPNREIVLPVANTAMPFASTGFTLLNPGAENAVADLFLHDAEGVLLATAQTALPPASRQGAFIPEIDWTVQPGLMLPPLDEFQGLVVISSPDPVTASLVHLRPGHFALLPLFLGSR
ncbi:MAG TPA: hypothetical protein VLV83_11020 [Acidobacteriota bacterium]|nr:hypothetical protein [Acidobacteriota bacterium]